MDKQPGSQGIGVSWLGVATSSLAVSSSNRQMQMQTHVHASAHAHVPKRAHIHTRGKTTLPAATARIIGVDIGSSSQLINREGNVCKADGLSALLGQVAAAAIQRSSESILGRLHGPCTLCYCFGYALMNALTV